MNQQTVYQTVSVQDELPGEGEDILISYDNGQTFPESAAFRETRTCMLAGIGGGNGHFGSGFCTNGSSGCESGLILSDVTHWLKPTTGYFFTPEEFRLISQTIHKAGKDGMTFQTFYNQLTFKN